MTGKRFLTLLLFSAFTAILAGADITLSLDPARPSAGRSVMLNITASARKIQVRKKPVVKGLHWGGSSGESRTTMQMSFSMTSGAKSTMTSSTGIEFVAEKEGRYTIPPFEVLLDGKPAMTPEFTFAVNPKPDYSGSLTGKEKQKKIFAILQIPGFEKRNTCFVGEELPLDFLVFFSNSIPYEIQPVSQPVFQTEDGSASVRFRDYRKKNPRAPNYESQDTFPQNVSGQRYTVCKFTTRFRPISSGELKLDAAWSVQFTDGMGFFSRYSDPQTIHASLSSPVRAEPLPEKPKDMPPFCGLVGSRWKITGDLHLGKSAVGDPVTLKVQITGTGSTEAFSMPDTDQSGFRVYPPEINRENNGRCTVTCTMIPVRDGKLTVRTGFSTFDPVKKEYVPFLFEKEMNIRKSENLLPSSGGKAYVDASSVPQDDALELGGQVPRPKDILYLHKELSEKVAIPLWKNVLISGGLLLLFGIIFLLAFLFSAIRENACKNDPSLLRRQSAKKKKGVLLRTIRKTSPENLSGLSTQLSDYLNGILDLPPGSGLSDAADQFSGEKESSFAQALKELSQAAWMPGVSQPVTEKTKNDLLRGISRFTILVLSLGSAMLLPGNLFSAEEKVLTQEEALSAYDSGDFKSALAFYADKLKSSKNVSPSVLYNMGNCYYQMGDLPRALVCYERASRLAPRDSDILENLNLTRRKLMLGEKGRVDNPSDLISWLRDILRIDEWLLAGVLGIVLCLASLGVFIRFRRKWGLLSLAGAILFLAAAAAVTAQQAILFSNSSAIIIKRNTPVYALPSDKRGSVQHQLKEGLEVRVEEIRLGWARIRIGSEEGWIRKSDMIPLWRENMSDLCPVNDN